MPTSPTTDVDEQVKNLADRFGTLTSVERPVEAGDFVSIDLSLSIDGEPLEDGTATGLSYEVGSDGLVEGLDSALLGLSAGESAEFDTALGGRGALVPTTGRALVTVRSVRTKQLPTIDDAFAQEASEFDTLDELRADLRTRLERVKRLEQGMQARDKVLEALLSQVEIPLPERTVEAEIEGRRDALEQQLAANGLDLDAYLASQDETLEATRGAHRGRRRARHAIPVRARCRGRQGGAGHRRGRAHRVHRPPVVASRGQPRRSTRSSW